jgi:saccharopine dehydrogenase-like NADP-dependent oxidoreductase
VNDVLVLGAGKIGRMVCSLLQGCGDYRVTVMDSHAPSLAETLALSPGARSVPGRFDDAAAVDAALRGQWAVISCAPFYCNPMIAERARAAGVHYFDLTEDVAVTRAVADLARGSSTVFMPQCGLAPGFITVAATHVLAGMSQLHEVKMRVGALPEYPSNALKYNLTWSTDGLINEYIQPCEAVVDGVVTTVPALEGLEHMTIDGIEFEAFNTSGGLGTFANTLAGRAKHLSYKTMRYPGHNAILKMLLWDLGFREHRDELKAVFERSLPTTRQDIVAIFVSATGEIDGRYTERTYARIVRHQNIGGHHWTAIQVTTACGVTAMVDLLREGKLPQAGFVRNEDASFADFIGNRFGQRYA